MTVGFTNSSNTGSIQHPMVPPPANYYGGFYGASQQYLTPNIFYEQKNTVSNSTATTTDVNASYNSRTSSRQSTSSTLPVTQSYTSYGMTGTESWSHTDSHGAREQ